MCSISTPYFIVSTSITIKLLRLRVCLYSPFYYYLLSFNIHFNQPSSLRACGHQQLIINSRRAAQEKEKAEEREKQEQEQQQQEESCKRYRKKYQENKIFNKTLRIENGTLSEFQTLVHT